MIIGKDIDDKKKKKSSAIFAKDSFWKKWPKGHQMLSVKRVKDNMRQAFIEKLFSNCEIGTSVQNWD
jgi:hypothetical protein